MTLPPWVVALYLGPERQALQRWWRGLGGGPRRIQVFHQAANPQSWLLLQALEPLAEHAALELHLVPQPSPEFTPDRERLRAWQLSDAQLLARAHGLPVPTCLPDAPLLAWAQSAMAAAPEGGRLQRWVEIGHAVFGLSSPAPGPGQDPSALLQQGADRLDRLGHYQGGSLHYRGEWYPGLERLPFLRERLRAEGLDLPEPAVQAPPLALGQPTEIEAFLSFRSPYSYLATARLRALSERSGLPLRVRPVLPMVMRGLAVPKRKRLYLAWDAARVARARGIPFGRIADPLGVGVERCLAICPLARERGLLPEFIDAATRGIWSEGLDVARDAGLIPLCERAGLDGSEARAAVEDPRWRSEVEENRQALLDLGLWGVPTVRVGDVALWGQDRLDWLEAALA